MANDKDFVVNGPVVVGKDTKVTVGNIAAGTVDLSTGNYFTDTLTADTTYTLSNAGAVQAFQLEVTGGSITYNIGSAGYDGVSFSVTSQNTDPHGLYFKPDGTAFYYLGRTNHTVFQYTLSTAWDLSTASYASKSFSVAPQITSLGMCVRFKPDGTKMYVVGLANGTIFQYSLSTAWDVSTASYDSKSFSVTSQDGAPSGFVFNSDGTKVILVGYGTDLLYEYGLSTAWDISTASYNSVSYDPVVVNPADLVFNADGTRLFIISFGASISSYTLGAPYSIVTASKDAATLSVAAQDTATDGVAFSDTGDKMYVLGYGNDVAYQYSTSTGAILTWPTNIEWADGSTPSTPAEGETDVYTFTTDDGGTTYTGIQSIDNAS